MIDLELNDPGDTLGDVLDRMPESGQVSIGIHGGYVYDGSVGGFSDAEKEIDAHHLYANRELYKKDLLGYGRAAAAGDTSEMERFKSRLEQRLGYAESYVRVRERHIIRAYARGYNDEILTMILEGDERSNSDPIRG